VSSVVNRILGIGTAGVVAAAWILTVEGIFPARRAPLYPGRAEHVALRHQAPWKEVTLEREPAVILRGWHFRPRSANGDAVLLLHGGAANRQFMLAHAAAYLDRGYTCLLIDQRGCGTSGGQFSCGLREPADILAWSRWLASQTPSGAVFAHGCSRGATTLLQTLPLRPPLAGVVAESGGMGAAARPYRSIARRTGLSEQTASILAWPLIESAFAWVEWRKGLSLRNVPFSLDTIRGNPIPVLLVHGERDEVNPFPDAELLRDANPEATRLLAILEAGHDLSRYTASIVAHSARWFSEARR